MGSKGILLDTCGWVWVADGDARILKPSIKKSILHAAQHKELFLASISLWEIATKAEKKRLDFSMPVLEWIEKSIQLSRIRVLDMTPSIACDSAHLADGFHGDPADRLIVATARNYNLSLLTGDMKIIEWAKRNHLSCIAV